MILCHYLNGGDFSNRGSRQSRESDFPILNVKLGYSVLSPHLKNISIFFLLKKK